MDPKEAETQRKMHVLAGYIEDQLGKGKTPRSLYEDIRARKVPHELAVEMIDRAVKTGIALPAEMTVAPEPASAGAAFLPEEPASRNISPVLPVEPMAARLPPLSNSKAVGAYVVGQLAAGVEMKFLVDELVAAGLERNEAIDAVVGLSERQKAEVRELARLEAGGTNADKRHRGRNKMLIGGALFFGGSCITVFSYFSTDVGGTYWIFYGPIIYGLISGIISLVEWTRK